tara:strand:+ start:1978 stop:3759 length:1782 start_codon:yes stop_codon:yes gene_type:complete
MKIIIYIFFIFLTKISFAIDDSEIIELHKNKSLDQIVLDQNEENLNNDNQEISESTLGDVNDSSLDTNTSQVDNITISDTNINDTTLFWNKEDSEFISQILSNTKNIKSDFLKKEFNNKIMSLDLDYEIKANRDFFFLIVKHFYEIGNISKAYKLISDRDINNDENINFYNLLELNYLLSTFKLEEVCDFKSQVNIELNSNNNILDKVEIFCLLLQDKISEAELLNSIMLETESIQDENFQNLFMYLINKSTIENDLPNNWLTKNINKELLYLYSAMARIAELPLSEKFLEVDKLNMAIPIILNSSTPIELRINAAHYSFLNKSISIESLAALYQSVDFDSNQLNFPEDTIEKYSGEINILMPFYFQLINIQIFPSERLEALINFWKFAEQNNLENIAYSLSHNIVDSIDITSDFALYGSEIATSYIYNKDYEKALNWINFYENVYGIDDKSTLARILLNLYSSKDINLFIQIINKNSDQFKENANNKYEELLFVLFELLDKNQNSKLSQDFTNIYDDRQMPSYFISNEIEKSLQNNNENKFLIYSIISLNNKEWTDIHPLHLRMILEGYLIYNNGDNLKDIILEIFKNYRIL